VEVAVPKDIYLQPYAPDPVFSEEQVLALVRRHVPAARALTNIDESGGEARTYLVDNGIILKVQRPQQLRPSTNLAKEVFFLRQLEAHPDVLVPRVLGYGHDSPLVEYTVMTRMPGVAMRHITLSADERAAALGALGRTLRHIHAVPQAPFLESRLFPGDCSYANVQQRLRESFTDLAERFQLRHRTWHLPWATPSKPSTGVPWPLPQTPQEIGERAIATIPPNDERVALHSYPYAEHTFVDPSTHHFTGLIDFGDAYISHPALDMGRWNRPTEREALLRGYTADAAVSAAFMATWRVAMVLQDIVMLAHSPDQAPQAEDDLRMLLASF
jgi:aminoglycoside phosphotransferase (APT) family kinase protein